MITREPKPGDRVEYCRGASIIRPDPTAGSTQMTAKYGTWTPYGEVVSVVGNLCYLYRADSSIATGTHGWPEGANDGFIWRFHDGLNCLFRIIE